MEEAASKQRLHKQAGFVWVQETRDVAGERGPEEGTECAKAWNEEHGHTEKGQEWQGGEEMLQRNL